MFVERMVATHAHTHTLCLKKINKINNKIKAREREGKCRIEVDF